MKIKYFIIFLLLILVFSCKKKETPEIYTENKVIIENFIHLSHTRKSYLDTTPYSTVANPNMDSIIENIDYSKFSIVMLGGDLTILTTGDEETIMHVDSVFNLGSNKTLWSLGNHDTTNMALVQQYTNRPAYYSYFNHDITFVVLNTQDNGLDIIGEQKQMLDNVIDTIKNSTHLILMHHVLLWMYGNPDLEPLIDSVSNIEWGTCDYCYKINNFYSDIYPRLVEVKEKGIEVICIAGDIGLKVKEFEYTSPEDIHFLASGIRSDSTDSKVLIFEHNMKTKQLSWDFKLLSDLNTDSLNFK